ncbi:MAG: glycoside hydrolase family 2 TIM barrel-domain containing protein [Anaerolineae bacterium]
MQTPRPEYPRPQFERAEWLNLNGEWRFAFDDADTGLKDRWYNGHTFNRRIVVPFAYQTALSGIGETDFHDIVWYERDFDLPGIWDGRRVLLHFGAVDYRAWVWVNGVFVTQHEGGHVPFHADITHTLQAGSNRVTVRVEDASGDLEQPRGKQYWERESASIFYTRTTGIWQTVWLEPVQSTSIESFKLIPDIDLGQLEIHCRVQGFSAEITLEATVSYEGSIITTQRVAVEEARTSAVVPVGEADLLHIWSPENPQLYDLQLRLLDGETVLDDIQSYFGMRKIAVVNGQVQLNNEPYYMRLVLDQGYHPQGLLTFPSDEAIRHDVELTKAMGFNGARKHQKVEEPRYLYWADHLGLLVWGEMANAYKYSEDAVQRITHEWQQAIARDFNHPSIVAWVPINESWGVPDLKGDSRQRDHLVALYHLVRSLDPTRLVISNDGWEHAKTDLLTIHDYEGQGEVLRERYGTLENTLQARPANRDLYVQGWAYQNEPILVTEFGGIGYQKDQQAGWGYTVAEGDTDFIRRYQAVVAAVLASPVVQGFCYTQITDVEQEINGLLTYDRQPKVDLAVIRDINLGKLVTIE